MAKSEGQQESQGTDYELIGVTVHTGTADGGHYYSFIRDRVSKEQGKPDKWFVKPPILYANTSPSHLAGL